MRLAQLARKLSVKTSDIIQFLSTKAINLEDSANTKLEADQVRLVVSHFTPGLFDVPSESTLLPGVTTPNPIVEVMEEETKPEVNEEQYLNKEVSINLILEENTNQEEADFSLPQVIRAPKIELIGLKVLGKIELPEKKKKEVTSSESPTIESTEGTEIIKESSIRRERIERRPKNQTRASKNSLEQARIKEKKEAEELRKRELEKRKELRTKNYLKKVQMNTPVKRSKQEIEESDLPAVVLKKDEPKTLWGKFVRWLTTY